MRNRRKCGQRHTIVFAVQPRYDSLALTQQASPSFQKFTQKNYLRRHKLRTYRRPLHRVLRSSYFPGIYYRAENWSFPSLAVIPLCFTGPLHLFMHYLDWQLNADTQVVICIKCLS